MTNDPGVPNPENPISEEKYKEIHEKLMRFFKWKGFDDAAEDLAQTTITRGLEKLNAGAHIYTDDPLRFFYGFAHNIVREQHKQKARTPDQLSEPDSRVDPASQASLSSTETLVLRDEYLRALSEEDRTLLTDYAEGLTTHKGLTPELLRIKVHRIRKRLDKLFRSKK